MNNSIAELIRLGLSYGIAIGGATYIFGFAVREAFNIIKKLSEVKTW